ncbi:hypothetical protein ABEG18_07295 [Alsobacter sp. KACC 23698]|uniref:Uncharacterized protein n=1 Tax=Alsobacter sp. KACC 23698 TaxID=3149229 RepID=A0AAU7JJI6_9HYPH
MNHAGMKSGPGGIGAGRVLDAQLDRSRGEGVNHGSPSMDGMMKTRPSRSIPLDQIAAMAGASFACDEGAFTPHPRRQERRGDTRLGRIAHGVAAVMAAALTVAGGGRG